MTWYINRGEDLKRDQKLRFSFYRALPANFGARDLVFENRLLQNNDDTAPDYPSSSATSLNCMLTTDLSGVDRTKFKNRIGADGQAYVDVHFDIVVSIESAVMKFSLDFDGKEIGTMDAEYD